MLYKTIKRKIWLKNDGQTASIYGACPWNSSSDAKNWSLEHIGYTVQHLKTGIVGVYNNGKPFENKQAAENFCDKYNQLITTLIS